MPLDLFKEYYVNRLQDAVAENLTRYQERKPWAGRSPAGQPKVTFVAAVKPAVPLELIPPDGREMKDFENAVLVHKAFPTLTPFQARDPRLWTRLTHVECWDYMRKRWDVTTKDEDAGQRQRYILGHYFVAGRQSRALLHNGLARLWWYAHLTHDPRRSDPYELTRVLLSYLDITQQLLERNIGLVPQLRVAFLEFIRDNPDRLGSSSEQRRTCIRELAKSLNLRGGVTLLDSLGVDEIGELLDAELPSPETTLEASTLS